MLFFRLSFSNGDILGQLSYLFIIPAIAALAIGLTPRLLTTKNIIYLTIGVILGVLLIRSEQNHIIIYKALFTIIGGFLSWLYLFLIKIED
ncbi:hypothetical protein D0T84_05450 [Dysgonomonas sp. 521]|nr:hypothetical protein [Dysgonomonas sp. 521]